MGLAGFNRARREREAAVKAASQSQPKEKESKPFDFATAKAKELREYALTLTPAIDLSSFGKNTSGDKLREAIQAEIDRRVQENQVDNPDDKKEQLGKGADVALIDGEQSPSQEENPQNSTEGQVDSDENRD